MLICNPTTKQAEAAQRPAPHPHKGNQQNSNVVNRLVTEHLYKQVDLKYPSLPSKTFGNRVLIGRFEHVNLTQFQQKHQHLNQNLMLISIKYPLKVQTRTLTATLCLTRSGGEKLERLQRTAGHPQMKPLVSLELPRRRTGMQGCREGVRRPGLASNWRQAQCTALSNDVVGGSEKSLWCPQKSH